MACFIYFFLKEFPRMMVLNKITKGDSEDLEAKIILLKIFTIGGA